jgi:DNA-binding ferritin-like protein (Dps family)
VSSPERLTSAPVDPSEVDDAVAGLDRRLRRLHLARGDRRAIVDDVRGDLLAAAADGVRPTTLIGPDVEAFAREAMDQGDYRPWRPEYVRTLLGGVLGTLIGLFVAYWLVTGLQRLFASWFTLDGHYPVAGAIVVSVAVAVLGVVSALVVLRWLLAGLPAARATVHRAALLLPAAVVVGAGAAVAVATLPDRPVGSGTVAVMALCVAVPFVAALGVSRWWALRAVR